jgi:hypothetical protein
VPEYASFVSYQAVTPTFQATMNEVKRDSGSPQIRLADIHVSWLDRHNVFGLAVFDIEPAGLASCTLQLPANYRLLRAGVGGMVASMQSAGEGSWELMLGPSQLPQRIEVAFWGPTTGRAGGVIHAPRICDLPVRQTLWTVQGSAGDRIQLVSRRQQTSPLLHEQTRWTSIAGLIEDASRFLAESNRADATHWYLPWATRYAQSRNKTVYWSARENDGEANQSVALLRAMDRRLDQVAEGLGVAGTKDQVARDARFATETADIAEVTALQLASSGRWTFPDMAHKIEVEAIGDRPAGHPGRAAMAVLLLGVASLAFLAYSRTEWDRWLHPSPQLLFLLVGMVWWIWLTPSILGLICVLVCSLSLALGIRRRVHNWRLPREAD